MKDISRRQGRNDMNINILICDDDLVFAEALCRFLAEKLPDTIRFQVCDDRNRLLELLEENNHCDLLLMDICLNEDNGICLAKELLTRFPQLPVIFITGYPDLYYEKVFLSLRPYGFVKKPVNEQLLLALVDRAMEEIRRTRQDSRQWILLKTKNGTEKIPIAQIRYVESQKHMLIVHGTGNTWETYGRLGDMALEMPDYFFHCHKSFLVNAHYIQSYEGSHFILDDGSGISISQNRRKEIRAKFFGYLESE